VTESAQLALCGWRDVPERHEVAAAFPTFAQAAPQLVAAPAPGTDILLYRAWNDALGVYVPYPRQEIGDCVSFGHAHGNDLLLCVEAALQGLKFKLEEIETDTEALYGMAREAGNMLGWQDGCYGSAAVKAMTTMGVVPRSVVGPYSGKRAKDWGYKGAPADVKEKAARWKLGNAALVKTWDELVAAMSNGYPVTICTGMGFTMHRDEHGFCTPSGRWGHCMLLCGVRFGSRPGACVFQSWGPNVPSGPLDLDQPDNSFWVDRAPLERILGEKDSWALSKSPFFVERPLPSAWTYDRAA
jgi:hypothetical protein